MKVKIKYVVYELNSILGNDQHQALEKMEFKGFVSNGFETEEEAIQALIIDNRIYNAYLILKMVYITE